MSKCVHRGFTLIEVLVVVAIIALLVAVLIPSLSAARDQAMTVVCKTRLRELYNGHLSYAQDSKQRMPHWDWWMWDGDPNRAPPRAEYQAMFNPGVYSKTGGVRPTDSSQWLTLGQIYRYIKNKDVYLCPKDSLRRPSGAIGGGGPMGTVAIQSYVRFDEPNALALRTASGNISDRPDDGVLRSSDFLPIDSVKAHVWDNVLGKLTPSLVHCTTTPDHVGLLFEEWPGSDDILFADDPSQGIAALNDGFSGFLYHQNYMAARHRKLGHIQYFDGHTALVDGRRFNFYPADLYAATMALGAPK